MKGRLFNILTLLSALSCVAAVALWVRSYVAFEGYSRFDAARADYVQVSSHKGRLWLHRTAALPAGMRLRSGFFRAARTSSVPGPSRLGFVAQWTGPGQWTWGIPYWALALLAAAAPAATLCRRVASSRRRRPGTCPACGYDLRATPEQCPECGFVPAPQPTR